MDIHSSSVVTGIIKKFVEQTEKVFRFFGIRTVTAFNNDNFDKYIPKHASQDLETNKTLQQRKVDLSEEKQVLFQKDRTEILDRKYVGFRANKENINKLFNDCKFLGIHKARDESDDVYQFRLKLALEECGLIENSYTEESEDLLPKNASFIHEAISKPNLAKFHKLMGKSPSEFFCQYVESKEDDLNTEDIGAVLLKKIRFQTFKKPESLYFLYMFTKAYTQEKLSNFDILQPNEAELSKNFNSFKTENINVKTVEIMQALVNSYDKDLTPTSLSAVKEYCDKQGIAFKDETNNMEFDEKNETHIMLSLLGFLNYFHESYISSISFGVANMEDGDELDKLLEHKEETDISNKNVVTIEHRMMQKYLYKDSLASIDTGVENTFFYQDTNLIDKDQKAYWVSDSIQPRGGRQDTRTLQEIK